MLRQINRNPLSLCAPSSNAGRRPPPRPARQPADLLPLRPELPEQLPGAGARRGPAAHPAAFVSPRCLPAARGPGPASPHRPSAASPRSFPARTEPLRAGPRRPPRPSWFRGAGEERPAAGAGQPAPGALPRGGRHLWLGRPWAGRGRRAAPCPPPALTQRRCQPAPGSRAPHLPGAAPSAPPSRSKRRPGRKGEAPGSLPPSGGSGRGAAAGPGRGTKAARHRAPRAGLLFTSRPPPFFPFLPPAPGD